MALRFPPLPTSRDLRIGKRGMPHGFPPLGKRGQGVFYIKYIHFLRNFYFVLPQSSEMYLYSIGLRPPLLVREGSLQ
jgi:hypothetical protein